MNFMGRYVYVATGKKGFEAIAVAEHDEPEAIFGSDLQRVAYPDNFKKFVDQQAGTFRGRWARWHGAGYSGARRICLRSDG